MCSATDFKFEEVDYRLVRSPRRKHLGLVLAANGVEVRIPAHYAAHHGHQFLQQNIHWVRQQLHSAAQRQAQIPCYEYAFGTLFPWLNARLPLTRSARAGDSGITHEAINLYSRNRQPNAAQLCRGLHALYQREALALLSHKSAQLAAHLGLTVSGVQVRRTKSKWGHCTLDRKLQYNWLICLAPERVVDYLVAHEVCHLRHHNHSPAFWQLVESVCPDFRVLRQWLREQGHRLQI